ncbi:hypothetical protein GQ464_017550 [Rhodocaloribacter litoris]|uniref:hypothetical protein n=1 Tax=Rhodocaloribacter litoris TaxID=2558931 RepID=UPI00141FA786|nr:hypothetical protein [Rhodocaloribacter litoris]QXD15183.1 hypothetical protein GQ464_017550 [Rhodocaloribacter litoris]
MPLRCTIALFLTLVLVLSAGCDADFGGVAFENQPPETTLSVRDTSLVDNLAGAERLTSTVFVSWSGTDPDGFVAAYELRFFARGDRPDPEEGWTTTTRTDSLVLLPIPRGERIADVTFEVRAIDNDGLKDPTPARTVFPIQNSPPAISLNTFDLPPDTTFTVFSFAWRASDPEGPGNLDRIEISLNDSTTFVALPPDIDFITLVGTFDRNDPGPSPSEARVFSGLAFQPTGITVPGLHLNADNTFYLRAVDQTDTTSTLQRFTWYVKKPTSEVLYVNDYRKATAPTVQAYHLALLRDYLPPGTPIDTWDLSRPFATGSAGNTPRSDALPPQAEPTLRETLLLFKYIYWVTTNATNRIQGNNLPLAASVMDAFFEQGGKLMVHTPITLPTNPEDNLGNAAILLLPIRDLTALPDSIGRLELSNGAAITPVEPVPGPGVPLPPLVAQRFFINELPYDAESVNIIPLYEGAYRFRTRDGRQGDWPGPNTVASLSADRRVGLFALPMVNEQTGGALLAGADGDPEAPRRAIHLMLESLGFPGH